LTGKPSPGTPTRRAKGSGSGMIPTTGHVPASGWSRRRTWWICGLLFFGTVLNYLDRQVLALTAERVIAEFHLTKEGFGHILGAFRYAYAIFQLAGGWLVDAYGARTIYPAAVGLWSAAGFCTAFAGSLGMLAGLRFLLGVGEAFNWPCALKVTQRLLPPSDRALANGLFNSGSAAGAMLAPVIVTFLALRFGYRSAFTVTGTLGLIWVLGWFWCVRGGQSILAGKPVRMSHVLRIIARIVAMRNFWMLAVSAVIINGVNYFLADWIPLYLKTERGFSFGLGNALSVIVYAGLDAGNILMGLLVRELMARGLGAEAARSRALVASCVCMSSAALVGFIPQRALAIVLLVFTAIGVAGFLVIYLTLVQDLDPEHVGAAAGLLGGLGNLAYGAVSPYIGRLSDLHETTWTFLLVGLLPWLALSAILFGSKSRIYALSS